LNAKPAEGVPTFPFVACASQGGPYDDEAFAAGAVFGAIGAAAVAIPAGGWQVWVIPAPLLAQVDLLAMQQGLTLTLEGCSDVCNLHLEDVGRVVIRLARPLA